ALKPWAQQDAGATATQVTPASGTDVGNDDSRTDAGSSQAATPASVPTADGPSPTGSWNLTHEKREANASASATAATKPASVRRHWLVIGAVAALVVVAATVAFVVLTQGRHGDRASGSSSSGSDSSASRQGSVPPTPRQWQLAGSLTPDKTGSKVCSLAFASK